MQPSRRVWAVALRVGPPLLRAILFPTYFIRMVSQQYETLRLLQMLFVMFEVVFFWWAGRHGYDLSKAIKDLSRDIKIAGGVYVFSLCASSAFIAKDSGYALTHSLLGLAHEIFTLAVLHFFKRNPGNDGDGLMS